MATSSALVMGMTQNQRISINLEDLLMQEDKLWRILDNIRTNCNFNFAAEDYIEFTQITSIQDFLLYFPSPKSRVHVNTACIYEFIGVMLCSFVYLKSTFNETQIDHLKNILYYTHQNLLLISSLLLKKVSKEYYDNEWYIKMKKLILQRKSTFVKGDDIFILEQNNNILYNSLKNFLLLYFNNEDNRGIFTNVNDILTNKQTHCNGNSMDMIKNNLMNLKNMIIHFNENSQSAMTHTNLPGPFLPKLNATKYTYTLVLDLDETIIHCPDQHEIIPLIRPGAELFLHELSKYYEIVIFTAAMQDYADYIIDNYLDKEKKYITHRLYRQHTTVLKRSYLKDISKLGRDLSKTIIVDNASDNFQLQIDNGIFINTWIDDESDTALNDLIPILKEIVIKNVIDVRKALRKVRDTMIRFYVKGDSNPYNTVISYINNSNKNK